MKRIQNGFTVIEVSLVLLAVAVVGFGGYYVWHTQKSGKTDASTSSSSTSSTDTASSSQTTLTLDQAVTQAKTVYAAVDKMITGGQVLTDKSQWAKSNVIAAQDLQFINAHTDWFTKNFISSANRHETDNTVPTGGEFLICENGSVYFNSDIQVVGNNLSGATANLRINYSTGPAGPGASKTSRSIPVTMKAVGSVWQIDSIDLSDTYCS